MARKLNVSGTMKVLDEETFGADETATRSISEILSLDNDQLQASAYVEKGVGGEVRGELEIRAELVRDGKIRVYLDTWLYEGTSEGTTDLDGEGHSMFLIKPNQTISKQWTVYNTSENCGDYVRVSLTCKNLPA